MADEAHTATDKIVKQIETKVKKEYERAAKELEKKLDNYLKEFEKQDKQKLAQVKSGKLTQKEYVKWRKERMIIGERWRAMRDTLADDLHNANNIAKSIALGYMPDVYAINHNYATYEIESGAGIDTAYTLYDRQTVEMLLRDNPDLLPYAREGTKTAQLLAKNKDLRYNKAHIQSELLQGILQGDSIPNMAKRMRKVTDMNYRASIRNTRTMATGVQNAARIDGYRRAEGMGIELKQTWVTTLDGRTRHSHAILDGETVKVGEKFSNGCRYPADPDGKPAEVYNCRCTLIANLKGFEIDVTDLDIRETSNLGDMTYNEWQKGKAI